MFRNKILMSMLVSAACLLMATCTAQAQRYRYGYYRPGYVYPYYRPYVYPYVYPYRYYYPYYPAYVYPPITYAPTYSVPSYYYYPVPVPAASNYYTPAPVTAYSADTPAPTSAPADIRVLVPAADATVTFDGQPTSVTGTERIYHTPPLALSGTYHYQIGARWMEAGGAVSRARTVTVTPGQTTVVDFR